jgi:hypothetical protein
LPTIRQSIPTATPWQALSRIQSAAFFGENIPPEVGPLSVFTAFQQCLDFVVIAQKGDEDIGWAVLKDKTQCKTAATLE